MKTNILPIILILFSSFKALSQGSIEVTVRNIRETKGTVRVGLFNNDADFLKNAVDGKIVKANSAEVTVVFENLKPGDYAVSVIHDKNENGKLDKNFIGIPKEGFAFGNNAMNTFGPPDFNDAKVKVDGNRVKQVISVKYM
jgi:uncharacterized protein (DUF2141 family)